MIHSWDPNEDQNGDKGRLVPGASDKSGRPSSQHSSVPVKGAGSSGKRGVSPQNNFHRLPPPPAPTTSRRKLQPHPHSHNTRPPMHPSLPEAKQSSFPGSKFSRLANPHTLTSRHDESRQHQLPIHRSHHHSSRGAAVHKEDSGQGMRYGAGPINTAFLRAPAGAASNMGVTDMAAMLPDDDVVL